MRTISERLAAKMNSDEKMQFKQKLLLYRRKWVIPASWVLYKTLNNIAVNDNLRGKRLYDVTATLNISWYGASDLVIFSNGAKLQAWDSRIAERSGFNLIKNGIVIWKFYTDSGHYPGSSQSDVTFPLSEDYVVSQIVTPLTFPGSADVQLQTWTPYTSGSYIIDDTPVDISELINWKNTNAIINQSLDTEQANVWKVGNLTLTLYNKNNCFWEGKEDGLFPAPYVIYGSKLEYYVGNSFIEVEINAATGFKDKSSGNIFVNSGAGELSFGIDSDGEYLQADSNQYVDLGFVPDNNTKIEIEYKQLESFYGSSPRMIFGAAYFLTNRFASYIVSASAPIDNDFIDFWFGNGSGTSMATTPLGKKNKIVLDKTGFYFNDIKINQRDFDQSPFTASANLLLFSLSENSPSWSRFMGRIYSVKIWQNGILVRDLYPVKAGETKREADEYVKCFTGYLTLLPTYRQDSALVDVQVANRLDYLKTVSAEKVSTTRAKVLLTKVDARHFRTPDKAVGRVQAVYKGASPTNSILLQEKSDYSVSDLNEASLGAQITLSSDIEAGLNIYADYIYWFQGLYIDDAVNKLLDVANITNRLVEPVIFQNAVRVYDPSPLTDSWMWIYRPATQDSFEAWYSGTVSSNDYWWWDKGNTTGSGWWGCNMRYGCIRFQVSRNENKTINNNVVFIGIGNGVTGQEFIMTLGGTGAGGSNRQLSVNFKQTGSVNLGSYADSDVFYFAWDTTIIRLYKNTTLIWSVNSTNFFASSFRIVSSVGGMRAELRNLAAKPSTNPFSSEPFRNYQTCIISKQLSEVTSAWDRLIASVAGQGNTEVRYGTNLSNWTDFITYVLGSALDVNYNSIQFLITNTQSFGNNYNWSSIRLWHFQIKNIPLGVMNFTNMDVLKALQEFAGMAMYEIGFDSNDTFFFRRRQRSSEIKELGDDKIFKLIAIKSDIDRMVTQVAVTYGDYSRVINSDTQEKDANGNSIHPNNKDKYGERLFELNSSQLVPASNVDLTYAIASSVYTELSKLRVKLTLDIMYDIELELGDYVRILHNNNLWLKPQDTDFTKWKELGTFFMRCKIEGIKSDFNKRTTSLTLTDFSTIEDIPQEEFEAFIYQFTRMFGAIQT